MGKQAVFFVFFLLRIVSEFSLSVMAYNNGTSHYSYLRHGDNILSSHCDKQWLLFSSLKHISFKLVCQYYYYCLTVESVVLALYLPV